MPILSLPWTPLRRVFVLSFALSVALCGADSGRASQSADAPPSAMDLVESAKRLLPKYDGEPRTILSLQERRNTRAAHYLLQGALELGEPDDPDAYVGWWLAHSAILLAEDWRSTGEPNLAADYFRQARHVLDCTIDKDPNSLWAWYERGVVHLRSGAANAGVQDFEECIRRAQVRLDTAQEAGASEDSEARFLRYQARRWRAEALMEDLQFDAARAAFREFYAANGNNRWDLGMSLGETWMRERRFDEASREYTEMLKIQNFADFDGLYTQLAYLAGLRGDRKAAGEHLENAMAREREPSVYPRLWALILSPPESEAAARAELERFVQHPPSDFPAWDEAIAKAALGQMDATAFSTAFSEERLRRISQGVALDGLSCEHFYYAGWLAERAGKTDEAGWHFAQALKDQPDAFKWEWAYARLGYARCFQGSPAEPELWMDEDLGTSGLWHRAGQTRSEAWSDSNRPAWQPGDWVARGGVDSEGEERVINGVVLLNRAEDFQRMGFFQAIINRFYFWLTTPVRR